MGTIYSNANRLSRLLIVETNLINVFLVVVINVEKDFLKEILSTLPKDPYFRKIYN